MSICVYIFYSFVILYKKKKKKKLYIGQINYEIQKMVAHVSPSITDSNSCDKIHYTFRKKKYFAFPLCPDHRPS